MVRSVVMVFDWKSELQVLRTTLRAIDAEGLRDHYYHAIVQIDGDVGAITSESGFPTPNIHASCRRVVRVIPVALPEGGHHLHFIFDDNSDESDHALISNFRREVSRSQKIIAELPKKVIPRIAVPPLENALDENLVGWFYLLHWLGRKPTNSAFRANIEFADTSGKYDSTTKFSDFNERSTVPGFHPIGLLTRTFGKGEGLVEWKKLHQDAGKILPAVIASSLSKPIVYASVNAIDLLLRQHETVSKPRHLSKVKAEGMKDVDLDVGNLIQILKRHHVSDDGVRCDTPLTQVEIRALLKNEWTQTRISRTMTKLFRKIDACGCLKAMKCYRSLCMRQDGTISAELTKLWLRENESPEAMKRLNENFESFKRHQEEKRHLDDQ